MGDRLQVFRDIYEAGRSEQVLASDTVRFVGGWRGTIGKWDSEAAISLNQNHVTDTTSKQVLKDVSSASLQAGLLGQAGGYDPFAYWNPASVVNPMLTTTVRSATRLGMLEWKMSTLNCLTWLAHRSVLHGAHNSAAKPSTTYLIL
jgi:iron complex outermembrane receptor protein